MAGKGETRKPDSQKHNSRYKFRRIEIWREGELLESVRDKKCRNDYKVIKELREKHAAILDGKYFAIYKVITSKFPPPDPEEETN